MIRLSLVSVGMVEDTGSVILVMRAAERDQLLVMEVGLLEGRAIAMEAEGVRAPRPLTHDLLHQVIQQLGGNIAGVQILDFRDKTFFANLLLEQQGGMQLMVDARPSDAIALALRSGAPIFATEQVMDAAGIDEEEAGEAAPDEVDEEQEDDESIVH